MHRRHCTIDIDWVQRALKAGDHEAPDECNADKLQTVAIVDIVANRSLANNGGFEVVGTDFLGTFSECTC